MTLMDAQLGWVPPSLLAVSPGSFSREDTRVLALSLRKLCWAVDLLCSSVFSFPSKPQNLHPLRDYNHILRL